MHLLRRRTRLGLGFMFGSPNDSFERLELRGMSVVV
jgi:hypothetical protein